MSSAYDDFLNLPHHVSADLPHMSMQNRAAQFAPFAALTGFESIIKETCRQTAHRIELDESAKEDLNKKLQLLQKNLLHFPEVSIEYFIPDKLKSGGTYQTVRGTVRKIDLNNHVLIMDTMCRIPIHEIRRFEWDSFSKF